MDVTRFKLSTEDVMLESQDCTRIRMNVLECFYEKRTPDSVNAILFQTSFQYARSFRKEVYRLLPRYRSSKCNDLYVLTIYERVINREGERVKPLCPQ
jgi:hypothetical protein